MSISLQFSASLGAGVVLGLANWFFWSRWGKALLNQKKLKWGPFLGFSLVKVALLGLIVWSLLTWNFVDPIGFLVGFSIVVFWTIMKGLKWNS